MLQNNEAGAVICPAPLQQVSGFDYHQAANAHTLPGTTWRPIPMNTQPLSFHTAYDITLEAVSQLGSEKLPLGQITDRILAEDVFALVDSPSIDASMKDGFAVHSRDIEKASPARPVILQLTGHSHAGSTEELNLDPGTAVRILTGAPVPANATAVLAEEFATIHDDTVHAKNSARPGRNILRRGTDVQRGERILSSGARLHPAAAGLLASGGHTHANVVRNPVVALLATGDEVIAPGSALKAGKLFASNLVTLSAWCKRFGFSSSTSILPDDLSIIKGSISHSIQTHDAVLTSGGTWSGERDMVVHALKELGWKQYYHRVRLGPGKGVAFGTLQNKPVFCLPGGPPSNLMAFLQLALPALHVMAGFQNPGLPVSTALLEESLSVDRSWTQCIPGRVEHGKNETKRFIPLPRGSRLQMLASANAVLMIPEGTDRISEGSSVNVQILT